MGQAAHKKMKNKKRTNTTANQDGKNTKQTNIPTNGQCVNGKLKVSQSDSECQNVELESETQTQSQKTKNASKTKIVLKPEDVSMIFSLLASIFVFVYTSSYLSLKTKQISKVSKNLQKNCSGSDTDARLPWLFSTRF